MQMPTRHLQKGAAFFVLFTKKWDIGHIFQLEFNLDFLVESGCKSNRIVLY